jgi:hypothetical protein
MVSWRTVMRIARALGLGSLAVNVGSVQFRLDGRELRHAKSPGAGDQLRLGDLDALPRLDVSTGVGSIRADFNTRKPEARNER